ncbi:MAG TPA: glycosyltransferase 87 family protein [Mycobacteriales bacterium]|nr:glycosyltransferase 87 family protein [Mycobacteriales bacterium]
MQRAVKAATLPTTGVLAAWCLLAIGDSKREGFYTSASLALVAVGFAVLLAVVASGRELRAPSWPALVIPVGTCYLAAVIHPAKAYMYISGRGESAVKALVVAATTVGFATLLIKPLRNAWGLAAISAVGTAIAIVVIRAAPSPGIDVWALLQQSSAGLVHGANMYHQHWTGTPPGELTDVYPYPPGATLLLAPFKWLLGDVRYGLALASVAAGYLVWRLTPQAAPALAGLIVLMPHWAFLLDQSWTEPLLVAELAGCILALRAGRTGWATAALAAALVTKQFVAPLLPLFAIWRAFGVRRVAVAAGAAFVVALPWLIADPGAMWHDAVTAELDEKMLPQGLDLPSFLTRHGIHTGFALALFLVAIAYAVAVIRLPRTPSGLALGCALVMWAIDLANKATFFNHYTFPLGLLVVAVAAAPSSQRDSPVWLQPDPETAET